MKRISNTDCVRAIHDYRIILELNGHRPTPEDSRLEIAQAQLDADIKHVEGLRRDMAMVSHKLHGGDETTEPCRVCYLLADQIIELVNDER